MQLRSKIVSGLVITIMVLAMAPASDAQVNITLYANGSAKEVQTNRNALTNDRGSVGAGLVVSGSLLANSVLTSTTLTITYGASITSDGSGITNGSAIPAGDEVRLSGATGVFSTASIITIDFTGGKVSLGLGGTSMATNSSSGSFRVIGVRIDATGLTAPLSATASLSNTANNYLLTTTSMTTITAFGAGLGTFSQTSISGTTDNGTATIFTNGVIGDANASLVINEGYVSAWRTTTQESNSGSELTGAGTGSQVLLTFTGIPAGVTLTLSNPANTNASGVAISDATLTSESGDNDSTITYTGTDLTKVDVIQIDIVASLKTGTTAVTAASITVNANMGPQGAALSSVLATNNRPTLTGGYPRFSTAATSEVTVVSVTAAATNLLIPFVTYDGLTGGYDTGISVANTTADPWSGSGGATAGSGTITVYFYPRTTTGADTTYSLTTATGTTPGVGLATDGTLASGGTWSVLLSELLTSASKTGAFTGYLYVRSNFILAHGTAYVTNFSTFTSASPALIVPDTNTSARTGLETLSQ